MIILRCVCRGRVPVPTIVPLPLHIKGIRITSAHRGRVSVPERRSVGRREVLSWTDLDEVWMFLKMVCVAGGITRPFISPTLSPGKPKFSTIMGVGVVFLIVVFGGVLFNIIHVI